MGARVRVHACALVNEANENGMSPLVVGAIKGSTKSVKLLINVWEAAGFNCFAALFSLRPRLQTAVSNLVDLLTRAHRLGVAVRAPRGVLFLDLAHRGAVQHLVRHGFRLDALRDPRGLVHLAPRESSRAGRPTEGIHIGHRRNCDAVKLVLVDNVFAGSILE